MLVVYSSLGLEGIYIHWQVSFSSQKGKDGLPVVLPTLLTRHYYTMQNTLLRLLCSQGQTELSLYCLL